MVVEHIGVEVSKPFEMAKWYRDNLGFQIIFSSEGDSSSNAMAFVGDETGDTIMEFFKSPERPPLCEVLSDPVQLHIALLSENPEEDCKKLTDKGAVYVGKMPTKHEGETLLMLRDPFGNMIQLVKRGNMIVR